jgi:hypothetical protein
MEEVFFVVIVLLTRQGNAEGLKDTDMTAIKRQVECLLDTQSEDRKKLFPLVQTP